MRDRFRTALVAAATLAMTVLAVAPVPAAAATPRKVAIIVGPVGTLTTNYRTWANEVAAVATAAGATVAKAYSPSATWSNVKAAVNGANVVVYFGHGNGFPNPYGANELTDRTNGWGLNTKTTNGDKDSWSDGTLVYCGERVLLGTLTANDDATRRTYCGGTANDGITPAPGFTMVYAQAHYAPGFGERYVKTTPVTTLAEAQQRVRNYSYPILRLGGSYLATAYGDADEIVGRILNQPNSTYRQIFAAGRGYSPSTLTDSAHADVSGSRIWVQRTVISGFHFGQPDYWYAFAGNPDRTPGGGPPAPPPGAPTIERLAGSDRYRTAAAISAASFLPGVPVAYVATGENFPDALSAGAAAIHLGGPVLLVAPDSLPAATAQELARLAPASIVVVGGPTSVSDGVLEAIRPYATGGVVRRIAGADRYATAAAISADTFSPGVATAYVATGSNFPDALAGVPAAGAADGPIILVQPDRIPDAAAAELTRLSPARIVVLGGTGVVSDAVAGDLEAFATSGIVQRVAGANRYATAAMISTTTFASASTVFVATGSNFPDALGGGPVAGALPVPLLLVSPTGLPSSVATELLRLDPETVVVLGGTASVPSSIEWEIQALLAD